MKTAIRSLAFAVTLLALAPLAAAQQACLPRDAAVSQLETQHAERAMGRGLDARGTAMVGLFVAEAGTWTIIATDPQGRACVVAAGQNCFSVTPIVGDPA